MVNEHLWLPLSESTDLVYSHPVESFHQGVCFGMRDNLAGKYLGIKCDPWVIFVEQIFLRGLRVKRCFPVIRFFPREIFNEPGMLKEVLHGNQGALAKAADEIVNP